MEILTFLSTLILVVLIVAVHAYAPPEYKIQGVVAVAFVLLQAGLTSSVHSNTLHPPALALGIGSLALVLLVPRWLTRVPGSIVALVLGTVATVAFQLPVDTIGSKFGAIPGGLPPIDIPRSAST